MDRDPDHRICVLLLFDSRKEETYDISTGAAQLAGSYEDTIVYTAAVK